MKVNVKLFRNFNQFFEVLEVIERKDPAKFQKIVVKEQHSENAIPFEMALPFRIRDPRRNFQIIEDSEGNRLTKEESDTLIIKDKLNAF